MTKETLKSPTLSVNWRRKLAGVEDLTHVYLISPNASKAHLNLCQRSMVGYGWFAWQSYRMNPEQALLYQKNIFNAMKKDSFFGWMKLGIKSGEKPALLLIAKVSISSI